MAATYETLATVTTSGSQSNVTFSNIPQTYTDLILVFNGSMSQFGAIWSAVGNGSVNNNPIYGGMLFYTPGGYSGDYNVYTGNGYNDNEMHAIGWGVGVGVYQSQAILQILNYNNTSINKSYIVRTDNYYYGVQSAAGVFRSTSAINILYLYATAGTITDGSTFTLYGIKAA